MTKVLKLYNTFTKTLSAVRLGRPPQLITTINNPGYSDLVQPIMASMYICGPTVYSDCHLGHALTYTRADLFRRFMKYLFNVRILTVMNITDVDDKIISRSLEDGCDFRELGQRYMDRFHGDMMSLRVSTADVIIKVTDSIPLIVNFIKCLEERAHTYYDQNGDICFDVTSVFNYRGRVDPRAKGNITTKSDSRDFVLWKRAKPGEPVWDYISPTDGRITSGRPGWHVQCSAIASAIFGRTLDFHFGGKDLIFPHHYNEEACCCAYHSLDTSESMHVWAKNWLHAGHLTRRDEKMSKSLGNVMLIRDFINQTSVNTLRIVCVQNHYRTDFELSEDVIKRASAIDHKLGAFANYLSQKLYHVENLCSSNNDENQDTELSSPDVTLRDALSQVHQDIITGVCEDFDLARGLESVLDLAKLVYSLDGKTLRPADITACLTLFRDWTHSCGLEYMGLYDESRSDLQQRKLLELLSNFRTDVREWAIANLNASNDKTMCDKKPGDLLNYCDNVRTTLDKIGFVLRDLKLDRDQ